MRPDKKGWWWWEDINGGAHLERVSETLLSGLVVMGIAHHETFDCFETKERFFRWLGEAETPEPQKRTGGMIFSKLEIVALKKVSECLKWRDPILVHRRFCPDVWKGLTDNEARLLFCIAVDMDKNKFVVNLGDGRILLPHKSDYDGKFVVCGLTARTLEEIEEEP